jgi:NADH:ubiquinone oxidoreductase subunit F (NADH-binding)
MASLLGGAVGPVPTLTGGQLIGRLEAANLLGRGGAGFPVGRKWCAVADRAQGRAVVLANGAEGEPLSAKDRTLMVARPHLVIDGAVLAAEAVGAPDIIFYVGAAHRAAEAAIRQALGERSNQLKQHVRVVPAPAGYVAGEESAAVHFINAGAARPTTTPPRPFERGVDRRPTLVQNVESLAMAALIARGVERKTCLVTVSGSIRNPGVREIDLENTLGDVVTAAGGLAREPQAVLLGGYLGGWAPIDEVWALPMEPQSLRARGLTFGCGVVHFLAEDACGVEATARIATYLASQSARQCGPCVFGLSAIGECLRRLAARSPQASDLDRLTRWSGQLEGRGACKHPDGAAGLLRSALGVVADDFKAHQERRCLGRQPAQPAMVQPLAAVA